jgi:Lrp/AsnC family transcriptional regulator, leucine-responsive regulatory protein
LREAAGAKRIAGTFLALGATPVDRIDRQLLALLQQDSRVSLADLGQRVGLSISAVNERPKKLHARRVLRGFVALVDPPSVGLGLAAFVQVALDRPEREAAFVRRVAASPEVQECHHVTGDFSYLLEVRVRDTAHLEAFLGEEVKSTPGVVRTQTIVALSTRKETAAVSVAPAGGDGGR